MPLPDEFIYQLKLANPIDTTMGRYVHLIRSGSNYKCLCPFHSEKTPSCTVYTGTQSFYCFGCGAGGDVITFTKQIENLDTYEAIKLLAERGGLEMPENDLNKDGAKLKLRILEMNREAANFFYRNLLQGQDKRGLQYAVQRGLTPKAIKKYAIGYAPAAWDGLMKHLEGLGFTREEMLSAGLIRQNARGCFDFFRERVMFPIIDLRGNVIAFGGRLIEGEGPKYLNSGDTPVFKKSRNLFSLNFAKNANVKQLILAEGYMDVIAINQAGFEQVVATLGTALTAEQARIMAQYATEVVLCYDSDSAGQNATHRAINLLSEAGLHTRILKVQDAKDPDEYIRKFGATRFKLLLDNSGGAINFELARCREGLDLATEQGKIDFLRRTVQVLAGIRNEMEREVYLSRIAKEEEISLDILHSQVKAQLRKSYYTEKKQSWNAMMAKSSFRDELNPEAPQYQREAKAEEQILAYLFLHPDLLPEVEKRLKPEHFFTSLHRKIYEVFCERMPETDTFSVSMFRDACSDAEMGRITGIMAHNAEVALTADTLNDCIRLLLQAKEHEKINADQLSDDDLLSIVNQARNKN
ncbi:DNA primase [Ruminococcus champanellensis]|uniref:DNA primase n=2 Tax=Ruminococcus TaxID=1263 RepID=D4L9P0_RUMC1|nr:DNA primase [Ruminococcus champanellensis]CBL16335.1 DNA primase, catalytic core [Ruminococcus champanellensis 18P13 = JCM 17042]